MCFNSGAEHLFIPSLGGSNQPQVAHVLINVSAKTHTNSFEIKALHDSGCAKSIILYECFKKIPNYESIPITKLPNIYISSCTGERTNVVGLVTLCLQFKGEGGKEISFLHDVLIHDSLEHDFLLGRDFTGSPVKILETNQHIYLSNNIEQNSIENLWKQNKKNFVAVPIIGTAPLTHTVFTNTEAWIPPNSLVAIPCTLEHTNNLQYLTRSKDQSPTFEVNNILQPILRCPDALFTFTNPAQIVIPVFNPTDEDIYVAKKEDLASIKFWTESEPIYNLNMQLDTSKDFKINNININEDENLNEEEKIEAFQKYLETGQYTMPMSSYIEKTPSVTEMSYKDTKPFSDDDFENQFDLKHLPFHARKQALRVFHKYRNVFSKHEMDLGCSRSIEMEIQVDATKPRIQKYYPLPHAVREPVRKVLDQMLEFNIIRECPEPSLFVSNLLVTKKKNNDYRILLDGRLLNNATIKQATTLVAPLEIFAFLAAKTHVSTWDISNAFFQVPIKFEHQPLTAFFSEAHGLRYCYTRSAQGLKNSPLFLKLMMDKILGNLAKYVIHYADDVMIATDGSMAHHIDIIGKVLKAFEDENIKIRPQKMEILKPEIEFLGVLYKKGSLNIPKARVQGFLNMARPKTPKQTKSFVCAMSYYRRFIPHFADLAKPLTVLYDSHPKQFKWLPSHDAAFKKMLKAIEENTCLNLPDPNDTFYVQTDASDVAGAGRVFQKDKDGNEKLLACVSRTFTRAERKYAVFRKEVLSLLYCLKSMDFFLRFAPKLVILIDAKSIVFLRLCKESAGILLRFSVELSKYEAEIHHVPGVKNEISDLMSRAHKDITTILSENKEKNILSEKDSCKILDRLTIPTGKIFTPEEVACLLEMDSLPGPPSKRKKPDSKAMTGKRIIKNSPQTTGERKIKLPAMSRFRPGVILPKRNNGCNSLCINGSLGLACLHTQISYKEFGNMSRMILPGNITKENFALLQKDDPKYGKLFNENPMRKGFKVIDNLLFKFNKSRFRLVLPTSLMDAVINSKHYSIMGLHFTKSRIRRDVLAKYHCHVRELNKKLQTFLSSCIQCQLHASSPVPQILKQSNFVYSPRMSWGVDIIPSLTTTKRGNTAIFLAVDMFTGYVQLQPIKTRQTSELIEAVKTTILAPFGIPKFFRCDNESGMANSVEFKTFMDPLKINFMPTSTASPWSNGAAERAVQSIKKAMKHFISQEKCQDKWDDYIFYFVNAHNKSANVFNYSPEELHFGMSNPAITDLIEFWPQYSSQSDYMEKIVPLAQELRKTAREKAMAKMRNTLTYRNKDRKSKIFKPGQLVLHRQLQVSTGQGGAFKPSYTGPYVINHIDRDKSSAEIEHLQSGQCSQGHFTNLQLLQYDPTMTRLPNNFDEITEAFLPEKYSTDRYHPWVRDARKFLNERKLHGHKNSYSSNKTSRFSSTDSSSNSISSDDHGRSRYKRTRSGNANDFHRSDRYQSSSYSNRNEKDWESLTDSDDETLADKWRRKRHEVPPTNPKWRTKQILVPFPLQPDDKLQVPLDAVSDDEGLAPPSDPNTSLSPSIGGASQIEPSKSSNKPKNIEVIIVRGRKKFKSRAIIQDIPTLNDPNQVLDTKVDDSSSLSGLNKNSLTNKDEESQNINAPVNDSQEQLLIETQDSNFGSLNLIEDTDIDMTNLANSDSDIDDINLCNDSTLCESQVLNKNVSDEFMDIDNVSQNHLTTLKTSKMIKKRKKNMLSKSLIGKEKFRTSVKQKQMFVPKIMQQMHKNSPKNLEKSDKN